ncbi:MAG: UDP binding domain-containing protein, partial [Phycisphaerales bacterium]
LAFWGVAFKPRTDDIREAPSLTLMRKALAAGAAVRAFDPVALENLASELPEATRVDDMYEVLEGADALVICTEWNEFRAPDFPEISRRLAAPLVFDGRNLYRRQQMEDLGFVYLSVGRPAVRPASANAR